MLRKVKNIGILEFSMVLFDFIGIYWNYLNFKGIQRIQLERDGGGWRGSWEWFNISLMFLRTSIEFAKKV